MGWISNFDDEINNMTEQIVDSVQNALSGAIEDTSQSLQDKVDGKQQNKKNLPRGVRSSENGDYYIIDSRQYNNYFDWISVLEYFD